MITTFLLNLLITITAIFPQVDLSDLPLIMDAQTAVQYLAIRWNTFTEAIPFMADLMTGALVVLAFEISLLIGKFFLGSRTPWNDKSVHF